ncbi:MAG: GtrA family protein [Proteobacteria bacterium]|nr:GtrA family protein [Pseudomonadota bacterium]
MSASASDRAETLWQLVRYIVNGVVATLVHYGVLRAGLEVLHLPSAGLANFIAAIFGITVSFAGSRYYVFRRADAPILRQAARFGALYAAIACVHALILFVWTDLCGLDYTLGFGIALVVQVVGSYFGNRYLVFDA